MCRRKFHGHSSLNEYYEQESCVHYVHNVSVTPPPAAVSGRNN